MKEPATGTKGCYNDSYEIIKLNESEPIAFKQTRRKQQELYNQNNRHAMLVIPKTIVSNSDKDDHMAFVNNLVNYAENGVLVLADADI